MKLSCLLWLSVSLITVLLVGCLTSGNPFYSDKDITSDPWFPGQYSSEGTGLMVTITTERGGGHYLARLSEGGGTSDYQATLFRIHESLFVDLFPIEQKNIATQYKEGYPTVGGLLDRYSHEWSSEGNDAKSTASLHLVVRVSVSKDGVVCFAARKLEDPENPIPKDKRLRFHPNGDAVVIDAPTAGLRAMLGEYAGADWERLFSAHGFDGGGFTLTRNRDLPNQPPSHRTPASGAPATSAFARPTADRGAPVAPPDAAGR
jgi:hypothetical protein